MGASGPVARSSDDEYIRILANAKTGFGFPVPENRPGPILPSYRQFPNPGVFGPRLPTPEGLSSTLETSLR